MNGDKTMTDLRKAEKRVFELLEIVQGDLRDATEILRQALAQPEQEPVGWADRFEFDKKEHDFWCNRQKPAKGGIPLYTAPPKREWIGLTDEEVWDLYTDRGNVFARAIEAKLKEKNNG
jgi:hypothetical protein